MRHLPFPSTAFSLILSVAIAISCAGCTRHEPPIQRLAPAPAKPVPAAAPASAVPLHINSAIDAQAIDKPKAASLMQAIFADTYRANDNSALLNIADGDDVGDWRMTLVASRRLPDGRTAVVVNGAPSDETGADIPAHPSPGMLNVYLLRQLDGAWQVLERHQDVATMGTFGSIGTVKWITLGENRAGIVVSSGGTWFGNTMSSADIYELDHGVRQLGTIADMSSNAGACEPDKPDCWEVGSKIGTLPTMPAHGQDYRDLVVDFDGRHFRVSEDAQGKQTEHGISTVHQRARYRFDGKQYVLAEGANPVPDIES